MNALIFGASGQDGHYAGELCRSRNITPVAVSRSGSGIRADVASFEQVKELVKLHRPAYVLHLAAASTTRHEALFENQQTIATGTLNILEAVKAFSPGTRVFLAGSGLQFVNTGAPIAETDPFEASSPYAVARIQSAYAGRYFRSLGLRVYTGYLFHHESPLRKPGHVSKMIALSVSRIAAGSEETLEVGDLNVEKEWTFAGDVTEAMFTLMDQESVYEAVIGSGRTHTIREWLEQCFAVVGKRWQDHVRVREGFVPEYRRLVSRPDTIRSLGWSPRVGLPELARMMVAG